MTASARPADTVTLATITAARARLAGRIRETPLVRLDLQRTVGSALIKAENLQLTGSFKLRGALHALLAAMARGPVPGVVTYSAGNHGRALAHAARIAEVPAVVVMPATAAPMKIEWTRLAGAEVVVCDPDRITSLAHELEEDRGLAFIHPFDDADVIAGQGTVALELHDQLGAEPLDALLVPVGGGGLLSGIARAVKELRPEIRVIGVEPDLAGDLAEGFRSGELAVWDRERTRRTIANGLRSPQVGALPWALITQLVDDVLVVSEPRIIDAMRMLALQTNSIVEPSGAVATAAVLQHADRLAGLRVAAIVSGGNIDPRAFARLLDEPTGS